MSTEDAELFELTGKDAKAVGALTEKGFLVREGALARKDIAPSGVNTVSPVHQRLLSEGVLIEHADGLRFTRDYLFDSPSGAAAAVLGRTANGWIEWKLADGRTLSELKRITRQGGRSILSAPKKQEILAKAAGLRKSDQLPTQDQLDRDYALFRQRFGPDVLAGLDGEPLLNLMHDHTDRSSLVYWLEFKNDEEFETKRFGSIAGGSALKFRVFRRKETGHWQAADKSNTPHDISVEEAIEIARTHREQLLRGVELLNELPVAASDEDYAYLQDQMDELAPLVSKLAWGHKYFSLLFPDKLDDFHSPSWQRFHLIKLLQLPPEGEGRYNCAGRFLSAARDVSLPVTLFDKLLTAIHGNRHRYWRLGTRSGKTNESQWRMMQDESCIAIGWGKLGDLSWIEATKESRDRLKEQYQVEYPQNPSTIGNQCSQVIQFVAGMGENDIVLAADGATILGICRVVGPYQYKPDFHFPHHRTVEWLNLEEWKLPESKEGLQSAVREVKKHSENLLAIESRVQTSSPVNLLAVPSASQPRRLNRLPYELGARIQSILERKGQVILYGPPGTGKTFWAEKAAHDLAALTAFGKLFDTLGESEKQAIVGHSDAHGLVLLSCFHPAYGYEDFLEGYRPRTVNGQVTFELRDGVFKKLCKVAQASPDRSFYLIVDEINRGDIPRIFGELLTAIEKDKRGKRIVLPVSQEVFVVPPNVYLIGTMNTADRSISLLDAALRRRFGFIEIMPDGHVLKDAVVGGIALRAWFEALNRRIREHVGRDSRNLQIGHSYLMHAGSALRDVASLKRAIRDDIIPLLEEYCYEQYGTLSSILGDQVVDAAAERIRHELFDDGQEDTLLQALLTPFADISTSTEAITSEKSQADLEETEEDSDL